MSTLTMPLNASVRDRSKAPGDHGFVIAFGFVALVWIVSQQEGSIFSRLPSKP